MAHWVASQVVLVVKNPPAIAGDVRDMGSFPALERSPEKGMAIHSSILAWRIPWTEEPGGPRSMGSQRVGHDLVTELTCMQVLVILSALTLWPILHWV